MKTLEKWYVWDGKKAIEGVHRALMSNGKTTSLRGGSPLGMLKSDSDYFIAYTLGGKVESKRKVRVNNMGDLNNCAGYESLEFADIGGSK